MKLLRVGPCHKYFQIQLSNLSSDIFVYLFTYLFIYILLVACFYGTSTSDGA